MDKKQGKIIFVSPLCADFLNWNGITRRDNTRFYEHRTTQGIP